MTRRSVRRRVRERHLVPRSFKQALAKIRASGATPDVVDEMKGGALGSGRPFALEGLQRFGDGALGGLHIKIVASTK